MIPIKPIRLNRSMYVRIPNDIAQLIEVNRSDELVLELEDHGTEWVLTYTITKRSRNIQTAPAPLESTGLAPVNPSN